MGNTSSQPLPEDELNTLWVTPTMPVQRRRDHDRSPSLPTSSMDIVDGVSQDVEDATFSRAARKQLRKEKREKKAQKDARRASRALRATTDDSMLPSHSPEIDRTQNVPDPSSQLLLEAAEHISRTGGHYGRERKQDAENGSTIKRYDGHSTTKHTAARSLNLDQSNIDPSLRDPSELDSSAVDSHGQHLLDWHKNQKANGGSGSNPQMRTVQVRDGVYAMVPQHTGRVHETGSLDTPSPYYHASSLRGIPKSPNTSRSMAQAAVMLELPQNPSEGRPYDISGVENMAGNVTQEALLTDVESTRNQVKGRRATKRRRQSRATGDETIPSEAQPPKKRGRTGKFTAPATAQTDGDGAQTATSQSLFRTSGPFNDAEVDRIARVASSFKDRASLSDHDFNAMVQNKDRGKNAVRDEFWQAVYDVLPNRQHVAIQRCARRRYHNYETRGTWTSEEDKTLKSLHALYPQKWVKIGEMMSRMPEDCRDRWRNYLVSEDNKRGVEWTQKEEMDLSLIVHECIAAIRNEAKAEAEAKNIPFQEEDWNSMVNYNVVSKKMGRSRSRLQCYQHWRLMQKRDKREASRQSQEPKNKWRTKSAQKRYTKMKPRDKVSILYNILTSDALEEQRIPWKFFGRTVADRKWTTMDRKVAFTNMKKLIRPQATLKDTVEELLNYFDRHHKEELEQTDSVDGQEAEGENEDESANNGEQVGRSVKSSAKGSKPTLKGKKTRGKRKTVVSAEMVVDSSEDEVGENEGQVDASDAPATRSNFVLDDVDVDDDEDNDDEPTSGQPEPDEVDEDDEEEQMGIASRLREEEEDNDEDDDGDGAQEIKSEDDSEESSGSAA